MASPLQGSAWDGQLAAQFCKTSPRPPAWLLALLRFPVRLSEGLRNSFSLGSERACWRSDIRVHNLTRTQSSFLQLAPHAPHIVVHLNGFLRLASSACGPSLSKVCILKFSCRHSGESCKLFSCQQLTVGFTVVA